MRLRRKGKLLGSAILGDVAASLGWEVTEDGQKLGDAEELAAEFKESYRKASLGAAGPSLDQEGAGGEEPGAR